VAVEPDAGGPAGPPANGSGARAGDLPGVGLLAEESIFVALLGAALRAEGVDLAPDPDRAPLLVVPPSVPGELYSPAWTARLDGVSVDVPMVVLAAPSSPVQHLLTDRLQAGSASILDASTATVSTVVSMLRLAVDRRQVVDPPFVGRSTTSFADLLSDAERSVLELLATGMSNRAIAEFRYVAERTVETHVRQIFKKLGLPDDPDVNRRVLAARMVLTGGAQDPVVMRRRRRPGAAP